jgi:hypothetical protein
MLSTLLALGVLDATHGAAQVPPRFYWKTLSGARAVPVIANSLSGNTNPFDPSHAVSPGSSVNATVAIAGYARTFTLFGRSAMAAALVPMGRISGQVQVGVLTVDQAAKGFGDPMIEFDLNVIGRPPQRTLPDVLRFEPGFSVDLITDLAIPVGEYDTSRVLNLGQNRWYGRVGAPIVWQLGAWVPGRRTTVELLPAVWLFGTNDDYAAGTLETDPMFQVDAHLTRDVTERFWVSLDAAWYSGGRPTIDGVAGESLNNFGVGATLGYPINENLNLTLGYKSTVSDDAPGDLQMGGFMVSLVYGWHPLLEGMRRLKE